EYTDVYASSISPDGRFVFFASNATNLVAGDTNGTADVFVRDPISALKNHDFSYPALARS
ncbi:MAG TPA: hypothetical protein VGC68_03710, partial [Enterovirga sp.]